VKGYRFSVPAIVITMLLATTGPALADVITPDSVGGQNITTASNFMSDSGDPDTANDINNALSNGNIYSEDINEPGTSATTSVLNNITIDKTQVAPVTRALDPKNPDQFALIVNIASILYHEEVHVHQVRIGRSWDRAEHEAWTKTIEALGRWTEHARQQYDKTHDKTDLERMQIIAKHQKTEIQGFIENKCFGGKCEEGETLLKKANETLDWITHEQERIAQQTPKPATTTNPYDNPALNSSAGGGG